MNNVAVRLGAFALVIALLFAVGYGAGRLSGLSPRGVEPHNEMPSDHKSMP